MTSLAILNIGKPRMWNFFPMLIEGQDIFFDVRIKNEKYPCKIEISPRFVDEDSARDSIYVELGSNENKKFRFKIHGKPTGQHKMNFVLFRKIKGGSFVMDHETKKFPINIHSWSVFFTGMGVISGIIIGVLGLILTNI